jgi:tripartite-type tricarboxylate transporter receptor subunit TctC
VAAKGTPPEILEKLNRAINDIIAKPDVWEKMDKLGLLTIGGDVPTASKFVANEIEKYKNIVATTGVKRE